MQTSGVSGAHVPKRLCWLNKPCCCRCRVILGQAQERTGGVLSSRSCLPRKGRGGRRSVQRPRQGPASDHKDSWSLLPAVTQEPSRERETEAQNPRTKPPAAPHPHQGADWRPKEPGAWLVMASLSSLLLQWPLRHSVPHLLCGLSNSCPLHSPAPALPRAGSLKEAGQAGPHHRASLGKCQRGVRGPCVPSEPKCQDRALVGPVPWGPHITHLFL